MAEEGSVVDVEELKSRARSLERDGQLAEAFAAYRQILHHLEQQGDLAGALPIYVKAGDLAMKTGDQKGGLGLYGRAAKRYAEAGSADSVVALCTKIVRTSPANTYVYPRLARLMIARDHIDGARALLVDYAAKTKQAKGREALERLAGRPDAQVKGILEKLLDAAEKRERAVAERAKRAAAQTPPPAPPPEQPPHAAEPDIRSRATPEQPPAEVEEVAAPVEVQAHEPPAEEIPPVQPDSPREVEPEPEQDVEPIAASDIPSVEETESVAEDVESQAVEAARQPLETPPSYETEPVDLEPAAVSEEPSDAAFDPHAVDIEPPASPEREPDVPEPTEPEPSVAQPEFEAPAIELDAEPRFEPPRLTPFPEPEPGAVGTGQGDDVPGVTDQQSSDWSPWPAPEPEPVREVSAGGRMTDEPLIFAAQEAPKRSGKVWMVVGTVVVVAGAGGLFATGILGGGGGGGETPTEPAAPQRPAVNPPSSDSAGMPLAMADSLSRDTATRDSLVDSLAVDSAALALLDSAPSGDTVTAAPGDTVVIGDSATGGGVIPDSGTTGADSGLVPPPPDTTAAIPPPLVAPDQPSDTTPEAALASIGRPAVIIEGLPILNVREVVSNGRPGVQVGQAHPSGEPLSVVTVPLGSDTAAMGVITLPGDTTVGTTRMGNFLVSVRGRVPADTLSALLRRLTVARTN